MAKNEDKIKQKLMQSTIVVNKERYNSYYDNTFKKEVIHHTKMVLLGILTLGFAYPWILCSQQRMLCEHTVIRGKRMKFIGEPRELIKHWILWWFITIITFGIYSLVTKLRFRQWITANTIFKDCEAMI